MQNTALKVQWQAGAGCPLSQSMGAQSAAHIASLTGPGMYPKGLANAVGVHAGGHMLDKVALQLRGNSACEFNDLCSHRQYLSMLQHA